MLLDAQPCFAELGVAVQLGDLPVRRHFDAFGLGKACQHLLAAFIIIDRWL